ncbi:MAG: AAA-like domain-containing protein [Leptolyngbyaceae cyanobacterium bins.59]|nr:AAA-like domain-containing protein [Leptolyngbyaceae cyanobacterium bins.59]
MGVDEALELADRLVCQHTGKHLNDLEREVFLGSWQGQTYEKIYPLNPQYIEKDVGYKLWKKLSAALGEKVTKKNLQGALERARKQYPEGTLLPVCEGIADRIPRIFISHQMQTDDRTLGQSLGDALQSAGYPVTSTATCRAIPNWAIVLRQELEQCDYLILILSTPALMSELVLEELRQVRQIQENRRDRRPVILPIRTADGPSLALNYELRTFLQDYSPWEWRSAEDTPVLLKKLLSGLRSGDWGMGNGEWGNRDGKDINALPITLDLPAALPSPVAEPELPGGQVRLSSAFYIERVPYEAQCYRAILQPGALIRIKAPRQMGKTSLMARILAYAREQGCRTVPLSFQQADASVFSHLNLLLRWFCGRVSRKLKIADRIDEYWSDTYGSKDNCTAYFEDCLLSETDAPLILGLDEVDRVFQYPQIADDFFGLLRAWYEEAGYGDGDSDRWQNLRLIVVHSTEVYIPLNVNQSPFNVGLPIELPEFSPDQVADLANRHGLQWSSSEIRWLMALVGGHPYLVRLALYHIAQKQLTLEELLPVAPTEAGPYDDHLRRHLWNLQQHPELAIAYSKVVNADVPIDLESIPAFKLHSLGLVKMQGNRVVPSLELYRQYFRDRNLLNG